MKPRNPRELWIWSGSLYAAQVGPSLK
jgi:hypothetical protein